MFHPDTAGVEADPVQNLTSPEWNNHHAYLHTFNHCNTVCVVKHIAQPLFHDVKQICLGLSKTLQEAKQGQISFLLTYMATYTKWFLHKWLHSYILCNVKLRQMN